MKRSTKKLIAILCVAFFILSMAVPAFATSKNTVNKVPQVKDEHPFYKDDAPVLTIKEENESISTGKAFQFELRLKNAKWLKDDAGNFKIGEAATRAAIDVIDVGGNATISAIKFYGDNILSLEVMKTGTGDLVIKVPLISKVDGEGNVEVEVDGRDSPISSGTYVYAVSAAGKTITSISKVNKFAGRTGELALIRIDETRIGSLGTSNQAIKLKLPPKFVWSKAGNPSGLANKYEITTPEAIGIGTRTLTLTVNLGAVSRTARGSIFLEGLEITADRDAPYGDVVIDVDGDNVTAAELLVAKRMEYEAEVTVKEVKELVAGRWDSGNKTAKIKIEEKVKGSSFIANREIAVILPEWVKIAKAPTGSEYSLGSKKNELYIDVGKTPASKYEFELELSIEADQSGDIVAEVSGAGIEKQEVVIAKAVAPITAEVAATDLKIGVQNQPAPDIIITETKKGMIDDGALDVYTNTSEYSGTKTDVSSRELTVTLPSGIDFASAPDVEVTEGNLEIGKAKVSKNVLTIPITSTSTKPSTIKISDVKLTLDRTVPEGEFKANIGGGALVKNYEYNVGMKAPVTFDKNRVVRFVFANVITPAPGETRATSVFTIGSTTYTVIEQNQTVEKTMDVAPYIKDGRTFLPLRYVANALGVDDDNIIWDPVTKAVTIFKGDRIAQVTIGSKTMLVNGVTINMDVAPEITDGRTMLPIRWMGQALGATIDWDAEARSVTVKQ